MIGYRNHFYKRFIYQKKYAIIITDNTIIDNGKIDNSIINCSYIGQYENKNNNLNKGG